MMETHCVCRDAGSRRPDPQAVLVKMLIRFTGPGTQIIDGKIKRVVPLLSLRS